MFKCAEYGVDRDLAEELYKIARPRKIIDAYTGKYLGDEDSYLQKATPVKVAPPQKTPVNVAPPQKTTAKVAPPQKTPVKVAPPPKAAPAKVAPPPKAAPAAPFKPRGNVWMAVQNGLDNY